jgi:Cu/Ag efflux pump CusA
VAEAQARIAKNIHLPIGYRIVWAGKFQDLQTAKQRLAVFVPMSLAMIMILLYSLFNSVPVPAQVGRTQWTNSTRANGGLMRAPPSS